MVLKIENKIKDSAALKILFTIAFAAAYIVSEPTLSSTYFLYFTYRMQTLVIYANYAVLALVYLLTVLGYRHAAAIYCRLHRIPCCDADEPGDGQHGQMVRFLLLFPDPAADRFPFLLQRRREKILSHHGINNLSDPGGPEYYLLFFPAALYRRGKRLERRILPRL